MTPCFTMLASQRRRPIFSLRTFGITQQHAFLKNYAHWNNHVLSNLVMKNYLDKNEFTCITLRSMSERVELFLANILLRRQGLLGGKACCPCSSCPRRRSTK